MHDHRAHSVIAVESPTGRLPTPWPYYDATGNWVGPVEIVRIWKEYETLPADEKRSVIQRLQEWCDIQRLQIADEIAACQSPKE